MKIQLQSIDYKSIEWTARYKSSLFGRWERIVHTVNHRERMTRLGAEVTGVPWTTYHTTPAYTERYERTFGSAQDALLAVLKQLRESGV